MSFPPTHLIYPSPTNPDNIPEQKDRLPKPRNNLLSPSGLQVVYKWSTCDRLRVVYEWRTSGLVVPHRMLLSAKNAVKCLDLI